MPLPRGNVAGVVVSLSLHGLLLLVLTHHWVPTPEKRNVTTPRFIEAKLLQMEPAAIEPKAEPPKPEPQPKPQPKPEPREDKAAQQRAEERQRKEQEAKEAVEKKRQEAERQKEITRKKELERQQQLKKEAERKRQEELARQREQQRQQELLQSLAREEEMLAQQEREAELQQQVGTYIDYMAGLVAANWSRPPSATRDMEVMLSITLGSAGRVVGVEVAKSSGSTAFDRSAEQAVWKVGQFSRLTEMDPGLYQREFRSMNLFFKPEDLRM